LWYNGEDVTRRLAILTGNERKIKVPEPFRFTPNLAYLAGAANECLYRIREGRLRKALRLPDGSGGQAAGLLELRAEDESLLALRLWNAAGTEEVLPEQMDAAEAYVRDWFDLSRDLAPFYAMAERDSLLQRTIRPFYGLRLVGIPDLFEALSWGIIGQQINLAFAHTLKRRLVEACGEYLDIGGERHWLFPPAERVAELPAAALQELQMTGRKSEYLIGTARLIAEGRLSKELLAQAGSCAEAERMLTGIRGIGPWTANYVLMRCLRMPAAFPVGDVGLQNAVRQLAGMDRKPTQEELYRLAAGWTGWESYATFYLWRMLY